MPAKFPLALFMFTARAKLTALHGLQLDRSFAAQQRAKRVGSSAVQCGRGSVWHTYSIQPGAKTFSYCSSHSKLLPHPTTGVHTQHVKLYWNRVKVKLKRMRLPSPPIAWVSWRIHVAWTTWQNRKRGVYNNTTKHCTTIPSLITTNVVGFYLLPTQVILCPINFVSCTNILYTYFALR